MTDLFFSAFIASTVCKAKYVLIYMYIWIHIKLNIYYIYYIYGVVVRKKGNIAPRFEPAPLAFQANVPTITLPILPDFIA